MPNTFEPHLKEETMVIEVTKREAVLLNKLRKYGFGEFTVHKANKLIVRVEIKDSQLITEDCKIDIESL